MEKRAQRNDEELAAAVQQGDSRAYGELMARYESKLRRFGQRFLASQDDVGDTVQDVFVSAYQNIRNFDTTQRFSPWLYRIAHNAFIDILRRKKREPLFLADFDRILPHPVWEDPGPKEKEEEEMRVLLEKGLQDLPPAYREVIDLYYFEEFSYQEIADVLHIPIGTVGIRLSRGRAALKKRLPSSLGNEHD